MAGWRLAFAAGNADMIEAINLIQDHLFVSVFPAIQEAGIEALLGDQTSVPALVDLYQQRRDVWFSATTAIGWHGKSSPGTFTHGCRYQLDIPVRRSPSYCSIRRMWRLRLVTDSVAMEKATSESAYLRVRRGCRKRGTDWKVGGYFKRYATRFELMNCVAFF